MDWYDDKKVPQHPLIRRLYLSGTADGRPGTCRLPEDPRSVRRLPVQTQQQEECANAQHRASSSLRSDLWCESPAIRRQDDRKKLRQSRLGRPGRRSRRRLLVLLPENPVFQRVSLSRRPQHVCVRQQHVSQASIRGGSPQTRGSGSEETGSCLCRLTAVRLKRRNVLPCSGIWRLSPSLPPRSRLNGRLRSVGLTTQLTPFKSFSKHFLYLSSDARVIFYDLGSTFEMLFLFLFLMTISLAWIALSYSS